MTRCNVKTQVTFVIRLNLKLVTKVKAISHFSDSTYRGLICTTIVMDYDRNVNFFNCIDGNQNVAYMTWTYRAMIV